MFSHPIVPLPDQSGFEKLTIFLPSDAARRPGEVNIDGSENAFAFWSKGNQHFPGSACFGYASLGTIRFERIDAQRVWARVSLAFDSVGLWRDRCRRVVFDKRLVLTRKQVADLTPWEGAASDYYREAFP